MDPTDLAPWGTIEVVSRLSGGNRNEVWAIRVDGRPLVARTSTRAEDALAWEVELRASLGEHGLRTPELVPALDGRPFVGAITVCEMIDGKRPVTTSHWRAVARYLDALHEFTRGWPQRPGFQASNDLLATECGGDVDLTRMPPNAQAACRAAWSRVQTRQTCVVHGDPGASNIFVSGDAEVVLIDWDEARVDVPAFDLAALPDDVTPLRGDDLWAARQAASAWEAAVSWTVEPEYARRRLAELE